MIRLAYTPDAIPIAVAGHDAFKQHFLNLQSRTMLSSIHSIPPGHGRGPNTLGLYLKQLAGLGYNADFVPDSHAVVPALENSVGPSDGHPKPSPLSDAPCHCARPGRCYLDPVVDRVDKPPPATVETVLVCTDAGSDEVNSRTRLNGLVSNVRNTILVDTVMVTCI